MSFEDIYDHNERDQDQLHVRAEWAELRMKTRSKQRMGFDSAVNGTCGTRD